MRLSTPCRLLLAVGATALAIGTWAPAAFAANQADLAAAPAVAGHLAANPSAVDFGFARKGSQSSPHTVTIANVGGAAVHLGQVTVGGSSAGDFQALPPAGSADCTRTTTLPAGGSCTVRLVFRPSSTGSRTGQAQVASDDPSSPLRVSLKGFGFLLGTQ